MRPSSLASISVTCKIILTIIIIFEREREIKRSKNGEESDLMERLIKVRRKGSFKGRVTNRKACNGEKFHVAHVSCTCFETVKPPS